MVFWGNGGTVANCFKRNQAAQLIQVCLSGGLPGTFFWPGFTDTLRWPFSPDPDAKYLYAGIEIVGLLLRGEIKWCPPEASRSTRGPVSSLIT